MNFTLLATSALASLALGVQLTDVHERTDLAQIGTSADG